MIKKINLEKLLLLFIIIQPFLDFYMLYSEEVTNIFKFSPSTIIRIVFVAFFAIYLLFKVKYNKKYFWILGYLLLILVYLVFHILNSLSFNISIGEQFNFSYITELFYFIRMFIPILLIYITYHSEIKEEDFRKSILIVSLIFSLVIIITNIFKISLTSYGGNHLISASIFSWFTNNNYTFEQMASKGVFYMANQISGLFILLLPINIYYALRTSKKIHVFSAFCLSLAMIMLGTRIATYGWFLIAVAVFVGWIFFAIIHKNKVGINSFKIIMYILLTILLGVITINSPLMKRATSDDYEQMENIRLSEDIKKKYKKLKGNKEMKEFILKYSEKYSIPLVYIDELYPYENDSAFWIEIMKLPYSVRGGNRNLENLVTQRVYSLNNNNSDKYFGMGYSRFRNAEVYIEQDFVVQYYTIGIFGVILFIVPYFIIATYGIIKMLINKKLKMRTTMLCMSVYLTLAISYFSGHILDELIVTIYLGFLCGFILKELKMEKKVIEKKSKVCEIEYKEKKPFISVIIPIYNVEKYIEACLDSLVNQTLKNIEIICIDDGSTDGSPKILDKYSKKYENVIVKHVKNGGVASARNKGLSIATGEYIGFVDSDDYIDLTMYEKLYKKAKDNKLDIVACDVCIKYPNMDKIVTSGISNDYKEVDMRNVIISSYAVIWNKIYKKKILNNIRFKEKSNFCEDVEFLYKVFPLATKIGNVGQPLYNYIQREGSLTYVYDKKLYQLVDNFDGLMELYTKDKKYKKYLEEFEYSYVRYLYATFVKRLAKTKNKKEFYKGVKLVIEKVNASFPNYKKNKYIKSLNPKSLYLRFFNEKFANIIYILEKNKMN